MNNRKIAIGLSISLFVFAIFLTRTFPNKAANLPEGFRTPIISFEFAESNEEVLMMYNYEQQEIKDKFIYDMQLGNELDYIYMVLYTSFLIAFLLWLAKVENKKQIKKMIAIAVIALIGDAFENIFLLTINSAVALSTEFSHWLVYLHIITWIKWFALALIFAGIAYYLPSKNLLLKIINKIFFLPILLAIASLVNKYMFTELFAFSIMLSFLLAFINLFLYQRLEPKSAIPKQHKP